MIKPSPSSVLSIDYGSKNIGLAGCDPLGITVTTLESIKRDSLSKDLQRLRIVCKERNVKGLVIGLPLDENGNETIQSKKCQNYGIKIAKALDLPVAWVNEHSSTWEAGQKFNLVNDRTGKLDSAAARIILQQWLSEGPELKPICESANLYIDADY